METIINALMSRTNWMVLTGYIINVAPIVSVYVAPDAMVLINSVVAALAIYFRINPKQSY